MEGAPLHFQIDSIKVLAFSQAEPEKPLEQGEYHAAKIRLTVKNDKENNKVLVIIEASIHLTDEDSPALVAITTGTVFKFREGELFDEDENAVIPESALLSLASISYSTTRGILHTKVGASTLTLLILPAIPTVDLIKGLKPQDSAE